MTLTARQPAHLSTRERGVVAGIADGFPMPQVAQKLGISESTAKSYLNAVRDKLGVRETPALIHNAYRAEVLSRPCPNDERPVVTLEQWTILHCMAAGYTAKQMATELNRPLTDVRKDTRTLLKVLNAETPAHAVTRGWQHRMLGGQPIPGEANAW